MHNSVLPAYLPTDRPPKAMDIISSSVMYSSTFEWWW